MKAWAYWVGAIALILFGWIAIFSVGAPFLLLGLMLAVLFPWRGRRGVVATGAAVVLGFVVGYVLVAPLSCSGTSIATVGGSLSRGTVSCSNVLGIDYEGTGNYHPSLLPALLAGIALARSPARRRLGSLVGTDPTEAWESLLRTICRRHEAQDDASPKSRTRQRRPRSGRLRCASFIEALPSWSSGIAALAI